MPESRVLAESGRRFLSHIDRPGGLLLRSGKGERLVARVTAGHLLVPGPKEVVTRDN